MLWREKEEIRCNAIDPEYVYVFLLFISIVKLFCLAFVLTIHPREVQFKGAKPLYYHLRTGNLVFERPTVKPLPLGGIIAGRYYFWSCF